jgi:hypothetical protein
MTEKTRPGKAIALAASIIARAGQENHAQWRSSWNVRLRTVVPHDVCRITLSWRAAPPPRRMPRNKE